MNWHDNERLRRLQQLPACGVSGPSRVNSAAAGPGQIASTIVITLGYGSLQSGLYTQESKVADDASPKPYCLKTPKVRPPANEVAMSSECPAHTGPVYVFIHALGGTCSSMFLVLKP